MHFSLFHILVVFFFRGSMKRDKWRERLRKDQKLFKVFISGQKTLTKVWFPFSPLNLLKKTKTLHHHSPPPIVLQTFYNPFRNPPPQPLPSSPHPQFLIFFLYYYFFPIQGRLGGAQEEVLPQLPVYRVHT